MSEVRAEKLTVVPPVAAPRVGGEVVAGGVSGLVAGGAMAVTLVAAALLAEVPALAAFRVIGGFAPGLPDGSPGQALAGLVLHAAVSAALGVLFAWVLPRDFPPTCAAGVGVGYALFAMGFAISAVLPPSFSGDLHDLGGSWVVAQAVYGAVLGRVLASARRSSSVQKPAG